LGWNLSDSQFGELCLVYIVYIMFGLYSLYICLISEGLLKLVDPKKESGRCLELFSFDEKYLRSGYWPLAGVDEAGRGPLAGPVVAAAVILPAGAFIPGLDDSKRLPAVERVLLFDTIKKKALTWAIGLATVEEIDALNIRQATFRAMVRAVARLKLRPALVLVDGFTVNGLELPQEPVVGGDSKCASIAAASVLAKVFRDRLMSVYHRLYPVYGFDRHKGYPTPAHLASLFKYGPCPIHRRTFRPVRELLEKEEGS